MATFPRGIVPNAVPCLLNGFICDLPFTVVGSPIKVYGIIAHPPVICQPGFFTSRASSILRRQRRANHSGNVAIPSAFLSPPSRTAAFLSSVASSPMTTQATAVAQSSIYSKTYTEGSAPLDYSTITRITILNSDFNSFFIIAINCSFF